MIRLSCNSTGLTCINPICRFRPLSRSAVTINLGCENTKVLQEFYVSRTFVKSTYPNWDCSEIFKISFSLYYKTVSNWRHIINGPEVEYCSAAKLGGMLPFYSVNLLKYQKQFFPELSFDCPLQTGPYYAMNITEDFESKETVKEVNPFQAHLPNGRYRYIVKFSTKTDPYVFLVQWQNEIRYRLGEEDF